MALRLIAAGYDLHAFDVNAEALNEVVAAGATPSASAAECAGATDILLTSLPRPDHVESVMRGEGALAALRGGSVWVDMTTNEKAGVGALRPVCVLDFMKKTIFSRDRNLLILKLDGST